MASDADIGRSERLRRATEKLPGKALQYGEAIIHGDRLLCAKCRGNQLDFCERVQLVHAIARIDDRVILVPTDAETEPHDGTAAIRLRCRACGTYSRIPSNMTWQFVEDWLRQFAK